MTTVETLTMVQTIILALTALIVLWYTVETYRIRKETSKQNSILVQQYLIQQDKEKFELQKEINFIEPIFKPEYSNVRKTGGTCNFINVGSLIRNISVKAKENYSITIHPQNILNTGDKGKIEISNYPKPTPQYLHFTIYYKNKLEIEKEKYFQYSTKDATFKEIENL
jgi:hypothetical protein